jgi:hypothetical protein
MVATDKKSFLRVEDRRTEIGQGPFKIEEEEKKRE